MAGIRCHFQGVSQMNRSPMITTRCHLQERIPCLVFSGGVPYLSNDTFDVTYLPVSMYICGGNKKAFQLNVNCSLPDSISYIVNKFEHISEGRALYSEHVWICQGDWDPVLGGLGLGHIYVCGTGPVQGRGQGQACLPGVCRWPDKQTYTKQVEMQLLENSIDAIILRNAIH